MISAVANNVTRHSDKIAGASAFFSKPLDCDRLRTQLELVLTPPEANRRRDGTSFSCVSGAALASTGLGSGDASLGES